MKTSSVAILSMMMFITLAIPVAFADAGSGLMSGMHQQNALGMMDMDGMYERMKKMQALMNEAHNTKDLDKRHELMNKHSGEMHDMMGMMFGKEGKMPGNMSMEQRQQVMMQCMDMMQQMMEQMLENHSMLLQK